MTDRLEEAARLIGKQKLATLTEAERATILEAYATFLQFVAYHTGERDMTTRYIAGMNQFKQTSDAAIGEARTRELFGDIDLYAKSAGEARATKPVLYDD
jgi:hypothetical protein